MFRRQRSHALVGGKDDAPTKLHAQIARAQAGDVDAWEAIYRSLYPRLHAYARLRLPAAHLADDAVSETMSRALRLLSGFDAEGAGFEAWMFGILRNVAHESIRSFDRSRAIDESAVAAEPEPLAEVIAAEEREHVRLAFDRLTPAEQELLTLRSVARLSAADCATVLGRSPEAIRTAQSRALARLRTIHKEVSHGE